jgi:uncharacterized membrane protein SpoIIM required for sporulation
MNRDRFVTTHSPLWERLESLVSRAGHAGPAALSADELLELGRLYRSATSDLAVARRDFSGDRICAYLNGLVARAHPLVYRGRGTTLARIGHFVRYGFPQAYRDIGRYTLFAFGVFALSGLVAYILVWYDDSMGDVLLPGTAQSLRSVMDHHHLWMNNPGQSDSVVANFIMLNNIQVAFFAFAGGILLGVLATWVLATNGIMLGAIAAMVARRGLSAPFWSFIVPHGVVELSVIFMAGGAGLSIGDALLRPGLRRRAEALSITARGAVKVLFGCVPLLVVAGTIEGFLSPSDAPVAVKLTVGLVTGTALYAYLLFFRPRPDDSAYRFEDVLKPASPPQSEARALTSR